MQFQVIPISSLNKVVLNSYGPCIIYTIVRAVKDKNVKSLDAGVKNILQTCNRHLMNLDEKDNYKRDNWKRMILFAVFFS